MRKLAIGLTLLVASAFAVLAQTDRSTRPRVVVPSDAPPVLENDTPRTAPTGPPVLKGGSTTTLPASTPPPVEEDDEVIKVETNLVTMPVSVLDRNGRFIAGLQQRDFKIFENGIEQKVDYFQSVEQPFTVILLIDVSPSTAFAIGEIHNAAISFVDQLRPNDRVMVIAFDEHVNVLTEATNDRNRLRRAIRQAQFGDGTSLYEAVDYVIEEQLRYIDGRKAVVLFTDGVDTTSRRASSDSTLRGTEEVDALFYPIRYDTSRDMNGGNYPQNRMPTIADIILGGIFGGNIPMGGGGAGASAAEYETGRRYLEALAYNSGGRKFEAQSLVNVDTAFAGIAEELRRQYSLGYYPDNVGKVGDRKQIRVRVMRPNVVVRAKNSYIVGETDRRLAGN